MDNPDHEPDPMKNTVPPTPPEAGTVHAIGWAWGREEDRRPRLPWIGIFLVVYGALLLIERLASQYLVAGNLVVLAAGLASLIVWLLRRGTFSLYAGAFLTASAVPGLLEGLHYQLGSGVGTLCYGVALLFIGGVRMTRGGGVGWQAVIGVLLVALGGSELALPSAADLVLPVLLVVFGLMLLTRDRSGWRR
jgi:hypothetical protein